MSDYISREQAVRSARFIYDSDSQLKALTMMRMLRELPSVTPTERTGHWIRWYEQKENDWFVENIPHCKCSECNQEYDPHSSQFIKYCNECGAKMVEPQESEGQE